MTAILDYEVTAGAPDVTDGAETTVVPARRGRMYVLGQSDDAVTWDPENSAEVTMARAYFGLMREYGKIAYSADDASGGSGVLIRAFDPLAQNIIIVNPTTGG